MKYAITVAASWVFHVEADSPQEARVIADEQVDEEIAQAKNLTWEVTDVSEY